jgi:hypothetical protein
MILALYIATLALHAVFVSYVVIGSAYALVRRDALAKTVRDRLPFMLGCGITAGVAPLLFVQLLHQHRFYTANLLLGPRWLAVVPALVVGFYALYLAKTSEMRRRLALATALACFAFVAWSWTELHELMQADAEWRAFYAAGHRVFLVASVVPRLVTIGGGMATAFATVAAWSAPADVRPRLATLALCGRVVSAGGALWLWRGGLAIDGFAIAWLVVLVAAALVEVGAWIGVRLRASTNALAVATAAGSGVLVAAIVVREAPRLALIEAPHALADNAGGAVVFAVLAIAGVAAIAWIIGVVRSASTR